MRFSITIYLFVFKPQKYKMLAAFLFGCYRNIHSDSRLTGSFVYGIYHDVYDFVVLSANYIGIPGRSSTIRNDLSNLVSLRRYF